MNQRNLLPGLLLIGLGVFFLIGRNANLSGWIFLAGLGAIFLVAYFNSRSYGLLIPGCILLGLGLGDAAGQSSLGLGLGFIGIFVIDSVVRSKLSHWWPLIPGVIIAGEALFNMNIAGLGTLRELVATWWPLLLVLLGVLILFRGMASRKV